MKVVGFYAMSDQRRKRLKRNMKRLVIILLICGGVYAGWMVFAPPVQAQPGGFGKFGGFMGREAGKGLDKYLQKEVEIRQKNISASNAKLFEENMKTLRQLAYKAYNNETVTAGEWEDLLDGLAEMLGRERSIKVKYESVLHEFYALLKGAQNEKVIMPGDQQNFIEFFKHPGNFDRELWSGPGTYLYEPDTSSFWRRLGRRLFGGWMAGEGDPRPGWGYLHSLPSNDQIVRFDEPIGSGQGSWIIWIGPAIYIISKALGVPLP